MEITDIFERELQKTTVFTDRNALSQHYLPDVLPHRERQIEQVTKLLAPALSGKRIHNLFVYGKTGIGKTATTRHVIAKLIQIKEKYKANVDALYVNCHSIKSTYGVMLKCAEYCDQQLTGREKLQGFPLQKLLEKLMKHVNEHSTTFIVVLDEIDKIHNLNELMYALTRANDELEKGHVAIIGITNNLMFKKQLDPRSKSTLCEEEIVFPPYNAEQLSEILAQRVKLGFKPGIVNGKAVELASAIAAQESGDARYALKLLLKAGEIADETSTREVNEDKIVKAKKGVEDEIVYEAISQLPEHQKIALYAIANLAADNSHYDRLDGAGEERVMFSGEVYEKYSGICKKLGKEEKTARWCREYINELEMQGLVTTKLSGKGIRGNTTLINLTVPPKKVCEVIEKHFKEH